MGKNIFNFGLPQLGPKTGSSSSASKAKNHERCELKEVEYPVLELSINPVASTIWIDKEYLTPLFDYKTEADIRNKVNQVVLEVIAALGLANVISTGPELSIFRLRPDIWVLISKTGNPIGKVLVILLYNL